MQNEYTYPEIYVYVCYMVLVYLFQSQITYVLKATVTQEEGKLDNVQDYVTCIAVRVYKNGPFKKLLVLFACETVNFLLGFWYDAII